MKRNYKYKDLSKAQLKTANGCGSSFWLALPFRLPRCLFPGLSKACDCHDVGYSETGPEIENKWALDAQLVEDIRVVARRSGWIMRTFKMGVARLVEYALDTKLSVKCWENAKR